MAAHHVEPDEKLETDSSISQLLTPGHLLCEDTLTHEHRGTTISSLKPFGLVLWGHRLLFSAGFKMGSVDHLDLFRLSSVSVSWSSPVLWEILPSGLNGGTRDLRLTQCFTCNSRAELEM